MGSVCASTLALLNAGVPLKAPVAGIAMGLVSDEVNGETRYVALTDILPVPKTPSVTWTSGGGTKGVRDRAAVGHQARRNSVAGSCQALAQAKDARIAILG